MSRIGAHDIALYAINTGALYDRHVKLAKAGAIRCEWMGHVMHNVLPLYQQEFGPCTLRYSEWVKAAEELKEYYDRHAKEIAA